jgi:hypothetical protein
MADIVRLSVPKKRFRTGISNASRVLDGIDGRSHVARRFREVSTALGSDLGGTEHLTEAQLQLCRSAAGLVVLRESLDVQAANEGAEAVNVPTYALICNSLRRVLTTIGLERVPRNVDHIEQAFLEAYNEPAE